MGRPPPPLCLWMVPALMRGDRSETWLLLLCGWSFPFPWRWWRLRLVLRSEVAPFFTPAWICQAVIAPGRVSFQRKEISYQSYDAMTGFLSSVHRRGEFTFLSCADERVVCFRNGWVFSCEGWLDFGAMTSVDCLETEILIWKHRIKSFSISLNLLQRRWEILHNGTFYITLPTTYSFLPSDTYFCIFLPTVAPLLKVCLMWPDAEKELLFRFQSLPKAHLGAMSHTRLLAVIDLRSGTLWHCWKKSGCQTWFWCPMSIIQWNE